MRFDGRKLAIEKTKTFLYHEVNRENLVELSNPLILLQQTFSFVTTSA